MSDNGNISTYTPNVINPLVLEDAHHVGLVRVSKDLFLRPKDVIGVRVLLAGLSWGEEVTIFMSDGTTHVLKDSLVKVMGYLAKTDTYGSKPPKVWRGD
jgi:hypothetical protein